MPLAPNANFNGIIKHVGEIYGSGAPPGRSFNNQLLNTREENSPVLVGMGNAIKIYIVYAIPSILGIEKLTINLYWVQRVRNSTASPPTGFPPSFPSSDRSTVPRSLDRRTQLNCNEVAFFDVIASDYASPSDRINERQMNWQVIDLPLIDPPVDQAILPAIPAYVGDARGVIYETTAKADELFLYSQTTPDVLVISQQNRIIVDIAIGSNAAGESK